jgi:hypothetical protein
MAQHDYDLANAAGAGFRADANLALAAIVSNNSGATEPATMFAYMFWADTTTGLLKIRNAGNTAWITMGTLAAANLGLLSLAGGTMTGALTMNQAVNEARATVASHATTGAIWAAAGNSIDWTGTATATTFAAAPQAGAKRRLHCAGACSFTHSATLDIVGNANFTAAAGDIVDVEAITTTTFRLIPIKEDGTAVVAASAAITGTCRNLIGSAAGGTKTASWTADQLVAMTALSGSPIVGTGLALAFNGAVTGAGGMDTGATPTSGNIYIYAIYKPGTGWSTVGTIAGSGAQIYGGANMPSGYTHSCLIWSGVTDASAFIRIFHQQDRIISGIPQGVLSNATGVTSFTSQSVSLVVPPNAKTVTGYCALTTAANRNMVVAGDAAGVGYRRMSIASAGSMDGFTGGASYRSVPLITPQTIYWKSETADAGLYNLIVTDYSI